MRFVYFVVCLAILVIGVHLVTACSANAQSRSTQLISIPATDLRAMLLKRWGTTRTGLQPDDSIITCRTEFFRGEDRSSSEEFLRTRMTSEFVSLKCLSGKAYLTGFQLTEYLRNQDGAVICVRGELNKEWGAIACNPVEVTVRTEECEHSRSSSVTTRPAPGAVGEYDRLRAQIDRDIDEGIPLRSLEDSEPTTETCSGLGYEQCRVKIRQQYEDAKARILGKVPESPPEVKPETKKDPNGLKFVPEPALSTSGLAFFTPSAFVDEIEKVGMPVVPTDLQPEAVAALGFCAKQMQQACGGAKVVTVMVGQKYANSLAARSSFLLSGMHGSSGTFMVCPKEETNSVHWAYLPMMGQGTKLQLFMGPVGACSR